jgi:hypothetical protein
MAGEWRKAKGGRPGDKAPALRPGQAEPKWKQNKPAGPPVRTGRWLRAAAFSLGLVAVVAGLVIYINIPTPPPKPALIVVGADPAADAGNLAAPLDLYGWLGGRKMIDWAKEARARAEADGERTAAEVVDRNGGPLLLPPEDQLAAFVEQHIKRYDPVLLYFGTHCGVGPDGPHLVGNAGRRVRVGKLMLAIADGLTTTIGKKERTGVVILLDPARRRPDPLDGHLTDSFAAKLKEDREVADALERLPKMVVVCGASPGERGWESEELQQSAFARAALRGLQGGARGDTETLRASELFEFVRDKTDEWAKSNRPTGQRPFLLPDGDKGLDRAKTVRLFVRPGGDPPAEKPVTGDLGDLAGWWDRHDQMARRTPSPAAYSPRGWRRFRELLLRYEQAVRAGERETVKALHGELTNATQRIRDAALPPIAPVDDGVPSIALAVATGNPSPKVASADSQLRQLAGGGVVALKSAAGTLWPAGAPAEVRPAEVHLAVMAGHFYKTLAADSPPPAWATAVAARRLAEQAAVGSTGEPNGPLFPERVWPVVSERVIAADAQRRDAEDRLFTSETDEHSAAAKQLEAVQEQYRSAQTVASTLHRAAAARDRAFAELPFLGRWAAEAGRPAEEVDTIVQAWRAAHEVNDLMADPPALRQPEAVEKAGRLTTQLGGLLAKAFDAFNRVDAGLEQPQDQVNWWNLQHQFVTPFVGGRMARLEASRQRSRSLLDATRGPELTGSVAAVPDTAARTQAAAHARLARAALSDPWLTAADKDSPTALTNKVQGINDSAKWADAAVEAGAALADRFRKLSDAVPEEYQTVADVLRADHGHRPAVPLTDSDRLEPAAVAGRVLWRELLADHAQRAIRDHWYDEAEQPYFKAAAELYRRHAKRMTAEVGVRVPKNPFLAADLPARYERLELAVAPGTPRRLTWTSDRRRAVGFQVRADKLIPEVEGRAVVVRTEVERLPLPRWADGVTARRRPVAVAAGKPSEPVTADLVAADTTAAELRGNGQVTATAFFRGQRPKAEVLIDLNRTPQLVFLDPGPTKDEEGGRIAVRADPDIPLGSVVILVDYSGSMNGPAGGAFGNRSKKAAVLLSLRGVLKALPRGTPLRIRVFSDEQSGNGPRGGSTIVFPAGDDPPVVSWGGAETDPIDRIINALAARTPAWYTPLVDSIKTSVEKDFRGMPDGPKTLVVLTDGVEEYEDDKGPARRQRIADRIEAKSRADLSAIFRAGGVGAGVSLQVVQFGLDDDDKELSKALFSDLDAHQTQPATVWPASSDTQAGLTDQLLFAIRPKLRVTSRRGISYRDGLNTVGLKSTVDLNPPPGPFQQDGRDLKWSPPRPATDEYDAEAIPASNSTRLPLRFRDGDRIIVSFANDGDRGIRIRRELYSDYWPADRHADRSDGRWRLTVPGTYREFQSEVFHGLAFVERVPNHRLPVPTPAESELSQPTPGLLWWKLERGLPGPAAAPDWRVPTGTVEVRRTYGYKAPAWELTAKWPKAPTGGWPPARITTWVPVEGMPLPDTVLEQVAVPDTDRDATLAKPRTADGFPLDIRLSVQADYPGPKRPGVPARPATPQDGWLVVRVTHPKDSPVMVTPLVTGAAVTHTEHWYYTGSDGPTEEYTGVFGPTLSPEALRRGGLNLRVVSVRPLLADPAAVIVREPKGPADDSLRPGDKTEGWPAVPPPFDKTQ